MPDLDAFRYRAELFAGRMKRKEDVAQRERIQEYAAPLDFAPIENLSISEDAWASIRQQEMDPKLVFAHPDILSAHPKTSIYYRGISFLPRKQVQQLTGVLVAAWEKGEEASPKREAVEKVCKAYNAVISSIIEGAADWSLDDGQRNIIATMGITLDGMFRNKIGSMAETIVQEKILDWLQDAAVTISEKAPGEYLLNEAVRMKFGSDPDISFVSPDGDLIATIEIKGGTDPAGALERLGAMTKSFTETPAKCVNFLIAGVITEEMQNRLDGMNVKVFKLDDISRDGAIWDDFIQELFHHTIRIT